MNQLLNILEWFMIGTQDYAHYHYQEWTMYLIAIHIAILILIIILFIVGRPKEDKK